MTQVFVFIIEKINRITYYKLVMFIHTYKLKNTSFGYKNVSVVV